MSSIDVIHTLDIWHEPCDVGRHVGSKARSHRRHGAGGGAEPPRAAQRRRGGRLHLPGPLHPRSRIRIAPGGNVMDRALRPSPLLPAGSGIPATRGRRGSTLFRELLAERPFVFAPGVYDPMTAELAMYQRFD